MRKVSTAVLVAAATLCAGSAFAQAKPTDSIEYRQAAFEVIGWNMKAMAAMVQGRAPYDKEAFSKRANAVATVGTLPMEGFGPGTDKGLPTQAKPEIWAKMDDFKSKMDKMNAESAKLVTVAATGNLDDIKKQFGATGATCKACHDEYKSKTKQ